MMDFERIGEQGVKITLDRDETALLYHRLSEKDAAGGRFLIAALLAAAQEECDLTFSGSQYNVEILDSQNGAVIYITEIRPYYYLSPRRGFTVQKKRNKQLFCCFDSPEKLLRFVRSAACTFLNGPSSQLYTNGSELIMIPSCCGDKAEVLLNEFGVDYGYSLGAMSEGYELIIESRAIETLKELLCTLSPQPYSLPQKDSSRKL